MSDSSESSFEWGGRYGGIGLCLVLILNVFYDEFGVPCASSSVRLPARNHSPVHSEKKEEKIIRIVYRTNSLRVKH